MPIIRAEVVADAMIIASGMLCIDFSQEADCMHLQQEPQRGGCENEVEFAPEGHGRDIDTYPTVTFRLNADGNLEGSAVVSVPDKRRGCEGTFQTATYKHQGGKWVIVERGVDY